ncbi:MAG: tetratricopeptide repeat protein [Vicinamibacteria bacterium]
MDENARTGELRRKLEKDPGSRLFAQLAEELRKEGKLDEAIFVARKGLEKNPNYPSARLTLARALLDSGRPHEARPELEQIVKASPDNIMASRLLGDALDRMGEAAMALTRYEKTLRLSPGDKAVMERIAELTARTTAAAPAAAPPAPAVPEAPAPLPSVLSDDAAAVTLSLSAPVPAPAPAPAAEALVPSVVAAPVALDRDLASGTFSPGALSAADIQKHFDETAAAEAATASVAIAATRSAPEPPPPAFVVLPATLPPSSPLPTVPESSAPSVAEELPSVELPGEDPGGVTLPLTSMTLADLYLQQGLKAEASAVLSQVLKDEPDNAQARSKFAAVSSELSQLAPERAPTGAALPPVAAPSPGVKASPKATARPLTKAQARERTILSLKTFENAVEREAMAQRATERGVI